MPGIHFFSEGTEFRLNKKKKISGWLEKVAENEGHSLSGLNIIFSNDILLHDINTKYLNHNTLTDVITFDFSEKDNDILGDIYISIERVEENSGFFNDDFETELFRVMVHGLLHLIGYSDKESSFKAEMRLKEDYYLSLLQ